MHRIIINNTLLNFSALLFSVAIIVGSTLFLPNIEIGFGFVFLAFLIIIFSLIFYRKTEDPIWFLVLGLKLSITALISFVFIQHPLVEIDSLRTSIQDSRLQDSNYYDYVAFELFHEGLNVNNFHKLFSTWSSFGVILHNYVIYVLFGPSYSNIFIINSIYSLLGAYFIHKIFLLKNIYSKYTPFVCCLPLICYYDATPSKETLTFLFISSTLYLYIKSLHTKKMNFSFFALSVLGLTFIRPNLSVLVLIFIFLVSILNKVNYKSLIIQLVVLSVSIFLLNNILGIQNLIAAYFDLNNVLEMKSLGNNLVVDSGIKSTIINLFDSRDVKSLILYAPIRGLIWLVLPFPFVYLNFFDLLYNNDYMFFYQKSYHIIRSLNIIILIYSLYKGLYLNRIKKIFKRFKIELFFILFFTVIVSSFSFSNSSRYRILIEPIMVAIFASQVNSKTKYKSST